MSENQALHLWAVRAETDELSNFDLMVVAVSRANAIGYWIKYYELEDWSAWTDWGKGVTKLLADVDLPEGAISWEGVA